MKAKRKTGIYILVAATVLLMYLVFSYAEPVLTDAQKLEGLEIIYTRAKQVFAYWEILPDVDWDKTHEEFKPQVLATNGFYEYYDELSAFLAVLRDGHSGVMPFTLDNMVRDSYSMRIKGLPIELRYMEGKYVVYRAASSCDIPLGSQITEINGVETNEYLEQTLGRFTGLHTPNARQSELARALCRGRFYGKLSVSGMTIDGKSFSEDLKYGGYRLSESIGEYNIGKVNKEGPSALGNAFSSFDAYELAGGIYVICLPDFANSNLQTEFAQYVEMVRDSAKAFIIDERSNSGGSDFNAAAVLSHFCNREDLSQVKNISQPGAYRIAIESMQNTELAKRSITKEQMEQMLGEQTDKTSLFPIQSKLLEQPTVILTDWYSGSAGDDFVAVAKGCGRFTVMGTNTRGTTGQLAIFDLPGDGTVYMSVNRGVMEDGTDICNNGVQPDIWVEQTVEDALNGKDTMLAAAVEYLQDKISE